VIGGPDGWAKIYILEIDRESKREGDGCWIGEGGGRKGEDVVCICVTVMAEKLKKKKNSTTTKISLTFAPSSFFSSNSFSFLFLIA